MSALASTPRAKRCRECHGRAEARRAGLQPHWGRKVLEIRPVAGIDKGTAVRRLLAGRVASRALFAGDDRTDMDLYTALPSGSIGVHVGRPQQRARDVSRRDQFLADSPRGVRILLRAIVEVADDALRSEPVPVER